LKTADPRLTMTDLHPDSDERFRTLMSRAVHVLTAFLVCLLALPALGRMTHASATATVAHSPAEARLEPTAEARASLTAAPARPSAHAVTAAVDIVKAAAAGVPSDPLRLALDAVTCAVATGALQEPPPTLTLIDYSRPSVEPRLWVYDLRTGELLFEELVAHGRGTGENLATRFSDTLNSHQTSLGLFVTGDTYVGSNGYSLRLDGLEPGFNGRARERAIVMHGAWYVDPDLAASQGRIGRSWGCPALREAVARRVIDTVRGGGVVFSYYPDQDWLEQSKFLNGCSSSGPTTIVAD
jgi:hypothetical protein